MRTKKMLATATAATVASILADARARGWTAAQIHQYGNRVVRKAVSEPKATYAAPPKARKRVSEPQAEYRAHPVPPCVVEQLPVTLTSKRGEFRGEFDIGPARPKKRGAGVTHNVTARVPGGYELLTLSPKSVTKLLAGSPVWVGVGGGMYQAQRVQ